MPVLLGGLLTSLSLAVVAFQPSVAAAQAVSGVWSGEDGGTYYVREVNSVVWWFGMSSDGGSTWSNVFRGQRNGNVINGQWADVPMGQVGSSGSMQVRVDDSRTMVRLTGTGGFGGAFWSR